MSLQDEIEAKSNEIQTDSYPMSIGELMNMYRDEELNINPKFQRFFRWNETQKSKFIESILLGIPIPPIFVSQTKEGTWDVIDGLQRLSTILEFAGLLRKEDDELVPPNKLVGTDFLPSLENKMWENKYDVENSFAPQQRFKLKRAKLDINIIKETSDEDSKYELFQRINTGGTHLEAQEVRNCLLIMINQSFFDWTQKLKENTSFQSCLSLTDKQTLEQYDMELIMRYLISRYSDTSKIKGNEDIQDFITKQIINCIKSNTIDRSIEAEILKKTFEYLNSVLSDDSFRKYNHQKQKFQGAFYLGSFEALIPGIAENIDQLSVLTLEESKEKIINLYTDRRFLEITTSRPRPINRFKQLTDLSREYFQCK
ncbi:GmrSD restriction endonuclease domain-containing protein [Bacillus cereus]